MAFQKDRRASGALFVDTDEPAIFASDTYVKIELIQTRAAVATSPPPNHRIKADMKGGFQLIEVPVCASNNCKLESMDTCPGECNAIAADASNTARIESSLLNSATPTLHVLDLSSTVSRHFLNPAPL